MKENNNTFPKTIEENGITYFLKLLPDGTPIYDMIEVEDNNEDYQEMDYWTVAGKYSLKYLKYLRDQYPQILEKLEHLHRVFQIIEKIDEKYMPIFLDMKQQAEMKLTNLPTDIEERAIHLNMMDRQIDEIVTQMMWDEWTVKR